MRTFASARERDAAVRSSSAPAAAKGESLTPQAAPAVARAAPVRGPMTAGGVMQLQRAFGNRAVGQFLGRQLQPPGAPVIQRAKSEEERGEKHKRVAHARTTINFLAKEKKLKSGLDKHIFEARPVSGAEPNKDDPTGLHAYLDEEGTLHGGITGVVTKGSANRVHELEWHWPGKVTTKKSTMFPQWMPPDHVRTLISLQFPDTRAAAVTEDEQKKVSKEDTKTYIQRGMDISLKKAGDTVYPEM